MIVVSAEHVRVQPPAVRYRIEVPGQEPAFTRDAAVAARFLEELGVPNPEAILKHAREWGSLEIEQADGSTKSLPK